MDTRYLQCFISVADCGSIAEVARCLDLTPAAVSARLRALEHEMGVTLIQREGRSVRPTQAGAKILDKARAVVRDARDLEVRAKDENALGELRMGVSTSVLSTMLPKILVPYFARYPQLSMFIEPGTSSHLYHQVKSGELDAAIIVQPQFTIPKGYAWQLLVEDMLALVAPVHLHGKDPHELLQTEPFLRYDRSTWGGRMADRYLTRHGLCPRERLEVDGAVAISAMVAEGLGVSLIPLSLMESAPAAKVVHLPLPHAAPARRMGFFWALQRAQAELASSFAQEALRTLQTPRAHSSDPQAAASPP